MRAGSNVGGQKVEMRIVVINDQVLFRQGIAEILSAEEGLRVVGGCGQVEEAVPLVEWTKPDIVLLGGDRVGVKAGWTLREMLLVSPRSKIIIVMMHEEPRLVSSLVEAGADAYVLKSATREELLSTVRKIHRESRRVVLSVPRDTLVGLPGPDRPLLSARECEVLSLVASGMRNSEIAGELYISAGTVKRHLSNVYTKLGAASRIDAINKAMALGFVSWRDMLGAICEPPAG